MISSDPKLAELCRKAVIMEEMARLPVCYYMDSGLLMRKFRSVSDPADEWNVVHQVVIPRCHRGEILKLAHDFLGGHLGVRKTYKKILSHFYWPGMKGDVARYCRTCHECQMAGKPNQVIKPAPLKPIPVVDEPFSRVMIDCVGPLPKSRRGHQYLLTIMCTTTRYPEAIPLRNIKAKSVVKALTNFFTQYGIPRIVQSDQGTNFTSFLFQQVMNELGIKQYLASAYRPQTQGALERFHQTFKSMLRKYCMESDKDWDEGVPLMLFAIRLKPYFGRSEVVCSVTGGEEEVPDTNSQLDVPIKICNSSILCDPTSKVFHLSQQQSQDVVQLLQEFKPLFDDVPRQCSLLEHDLVLLPGTSPIKQAPYRLSPDKREKLKQEVEYLLEHDLVERSSSAWASPCVLVPKPDGSVRMCTDYRKVNLVTRADAYPLPHIDDIIDSVGQASFVTKLDLLKGYYQIKLSEEAKQISAFVTAEGLWQ